LGIPFGGCFFCRGVFARKNAEIPLYHTAALFVKRKFAQIFSQKNPKICATFTLAKPSPVCYNYTCQGNREQKNFKKKLKKLLTNSETSAIIKT